MPVYRLLYSLLCYLIFPIILLRLLWRSRHNKSIREHWQQRFGFVTLSQSPRLWVHAVSVGETIAAKPLVDALLTDYPNYNLLISNTTATGFQTSQRLFGDRVEHCYFPYDINSAVTRFLNRTKPALLIIMETEIWPNLLHQCHERNIPVLIANARLSQRSTKGYARILPLIKSTLNCVTTIACRSALDVDNFKKLGAMPKQLEIAGNIKFDVFTEPQINPDSALKKQLGTTRNIWVAASTHSGEDEIILDCYRQLKVLHPELILVLVPRHPERFESVFKLCEGSDFICQRRSAQQPFTKDCEIILGDSMGEMTYWYASADIVFLGGSMVETGGHNPLEATIYGVPVVSGPAIFNFHDVYELLCDAGIAWISQNPKTLLNKLQELLSMTKDELSELSLRAEQTLVDNKGATSKLLRLSNQLLKANSIH